ncbi:MAG: M14 family metallopeptidase [Prevotella sp.]|nr:M14 family metallopeptidase [Prevotellaceae bacterium]MDD7076462.1 M14 family metallopeptidase [Prevotellaceae bacterium]MDY4556399.1 M14 family metallopeptidase [Prevotella sp.]MDY5209209.1 M14 family metallopeptidase [Prevotella sp.]MDY5343587.1 M14 family metallopeptidase [Prevotella sp.]
MIKTIVSTALPINERFAIRKNIIKNGKGNRRVCIVTGTHGDELEGQMVCYLVAKYLNEHIDLLDGTVEIYPALNPLGIDTIQRGIPNFDLDMNRIFPGNPNGTMAEQAAYLIVEDLKGADLVFDIHSSNLYLRETPQVRINVLNEKELVPLAQRLNIDFVWVHDAATVLESTLAHSLNSTGTKCLVAELGVGQRINHKMCNRLTLGIFNLMKDLGMWKGEIQQSLISNPIVCKGDNVEFLNAATSGIFITELKCGVVVAEGEEIGQIVEPMTGTVLSRVISPVEGYMFTIRAYPIVYEGSLMARIFRIRN